MSDKQPSKAQLQMAYEAWDRHDRTMRADSPRSGATLLFKEAAEALNSVWMTILEQDAVTEDILRLAREAAQRAHDACLIAAIDPETEPTTGVVERLPDGGYRGHQV